MAVKFFSQDTIKELTEDGLYNLRRNAIKQSTKVKIYKLFNFKCELCGRTNEMLHLHHIANVENFNMYSDPNHEENIIILCEKCHRNAHRDNKTNVLNAAIENRNPEILARLQDIFSSEVTQYIVRMVEPTPVTSENASSNNGVNTGPYWTGTNWPVNNNNPVKVDTDYEPVKDKKFKFSKAIWGVVIVAVLAIVAYIIYQIYILVTGAYNWLTAGYNWMLAGFVLLMILAAIEGILSRR